MRLLAVSELSAEYGYSKQIFGEDRNSDAISRSYSGSFATYFLTLTAIEFNYYYNKDVVTQRNNIEAPDSWTVTEQRHEIVTSVYGVGLRQSLAPMKSPVRPIISLGYARMFKESSDYVTFERAGTVVSGKYDSDKERDDSVFATIALQIFLSQRMSLKLSVKSIFPAFEFNKAKDDLKYMAGFSWIL